MNILGKLPHVAGGPHGMTGLPVKGDSIVVCRPDGSSSLFLLEVDYKELMARQARGEDLSDHEMGQVLAAQKALALFLIADNETAMQALSDLVDRPDFVDPRDFPPIS